MAPSKIASAASCLPLAAWLRVNLGAEVFQLGNKPCPRSMSMHRERGLRTGNALRCDCRLPSSKHAVSILQLWCTLYLCMSRSTCIESGIAEGNMAKKAKKAKKKTGKKKKK
jgi:hypothetical protein